MDKRLADIQRLFASYAVGDFSKRLKVSDRLDDVDAIVSGLHMLAAELDAMTISREFFYKIFNTVSDMVLVLSASGRIEEVNETVCSQLGYPRVALVGKPVDFLTGDSTPLLSGLLTRRRGPDGLLRIWNRSFVSASGKTLPVEIVVKSLRGPGRKGEGGILVTAKDIGSRLAMESRLLRAVIDTQETERLRVARDLHDGLGQRLSAVKFLVSAAARECGDACLRDKLDAAGQSLGLVLSDIRGVCYSLMPKTLEDFGLVPALRELGDQWGRRGPVSVEVVEKGALSALGRALEIDLFRVVQEFVGNAVRHGEATVVRVRIAAGGGSVAMLLRDNGKGFETAAVQGRGMGLRNMHSRVTSHGGLFRLVSSPGKGTEARIRVVIKNL